jgi:hypothetical protein
MVRTIRYRLQNEWYIHRVAIAAADAQRRVSDAQGGEVEVAAIACCLVAM